MMLLLSSIVPVQKFGIQHRVYYNVLYPGNRITGLCHAHALKAGVHS
jgi:hypothetical protein